MAIFSPGILYSVQTQARPVKPKRATLNPMDAEHVALSNAPVKLSIDCAERLPETHSVSGLLNGFNEHEPGGQPPQEMVNALQPKLWRTGENIDHAEGPDTLNFITQPGLLDRIPGRASAELGMMRHFNQVRPTGAAIEYVLGEGWGYPINEQYPPAHAPNYRWRTPVGPDWMNYVQSKAIAAKNNGLQFYWDVWNEPDAAMFWRASFPDFCESYAQAARTIRSVLPESQAKIGGPSLANYNIGRIREFLDTCVQNKVEVNFLSWHELNDIDKANDFSLIQKHLDEVKTLLRDPKYQSLNCREIHVNEILGERSVGKPGNIIAALHYLERGGADKAASATWLDTSGRNTSYDGTLGGLLNPGSYTPKASWETMRSYALGVPGRVKSEIQESPETMPQNIVTLGSVFYNKPIAQALVGYGDTQSGGKSSEKDVALTFDHLESVIGNQSNGTSAKASVDVIIESIKDEPWKKTGAPYQPVATAVTKPVLSDPTDSGRKQVNVFLKALQPGELRKISVMPHQD